MEYLSSRKNPYIKHLRDLASSAAYRTEAGEYLCEGLTTLREALAAGVRITSVLWAGEAKLQLNGSIKQYSCGEELMHYASSLDCGPGPVFTVSLPGDDTGLNLRRAIVLENVQDPGNIGTVIRTANAFGIDAVILVGSCADVFSPKVVRASMAAIFRQRVIKTGLQQLSGILSDNNLTLYGAALHRDSNDIRAVMLNNAAVAVGSEGKGLSEDFLSLCDGTVIIPMRPDSESLNAAVAAGIAMWEMVRCD